MQRLRLALALVALCACSADAQWSGAGFSPAFLEAGGGAQSLSVGVPLFSFPDVPFRVRWNGQVRTPGPGPSNQPSASSLHFSADELATSQLAKLTVYDQSDNLIATAYVPVAYKIAPSGMAVDSVRSRVYVAIPATSSNSRFPPNSVVAIDASNGSIVGSLKLSGPPGLTAVSDDGTTLYQVVSGNTIQRIDAMRLTVVSEWAVKDAPAIGGLCVMPGHAETLVVNYDPTPISASRISIIYDNGIARPKRAEGGGGNVILISPDGKYLIRDFFVPGFSRFPVEATGFGSPVSAHVNDPVSIDDSYVYTGQGLAVDWRTLTVAGNLGAWGWPMADTVNGRVLLATGDGSPLLQAFSTKPLAALAQQAIGSGLTSFPGDPSRGISGVKLFRFGTDGLVLQYPERYVLIFHSPLAGPAPSITANGVVNAASFGRGGIAASEMVSIFGANLGPVEGAAFRVMGNGAITEPEAGMEVWFGKKKGTILYAYSGQINAMAPPDLVPGATVNVQVRNLGIPSEARSFAVTAAAPGLFTRDGSGTGSAALVNQDGGINTAAVPGTVVTLFGTGGGPVAGGRDDRIAYGAASLVAPVQVTVGGLQAEVLYAGAAPQLVSGVFQLNVRVPEGLKAGTRAQVVVSIAGQKSLEGVSIEIR